MAEIRSPYTDAVPNQRCVTIGRRGTLVIPQAVRDHATFVEGQRVTLIEATPRTLILTVEPDPEPIVAAVAASGAIGPRFPKIAARLASAGLERPAGRRRQPIDLDATAIDGEEAARSDAVSGPARRATGRRAAELPRAR